MNLDPTRAGDWHVLLSEAYECEYAWRLLWRIQEERELEDYEVQGCGDEPVRVMVPRNSEEFRREKLGELRRWIGRVNYGKGMGGMPPPIPPWHLVKLD